MKNKLLLSLATFTIIGTSIIPINALATDLANTQSTEVVSDINIDQALKDIENNYGLIDKDMLETSQKLENYFEVINGNVIINTDARTLATNLDISDSDAQLMIDATSDIDLNTPQTYGFVGVHINLGPKVRKMNGWAAGAFVGGYVGWYAKQFLAAGPIGAGVAGVITAGAAATAKWAVENGTRRISLGQNINGWNWNYTINIP